MEKCCRWKRESDSLQRWSPCWLLSIIEESTIYKLQRYGLCGKRCSYSSNQGSACLQWFPPKALQDHCLHKMTHHQCLMRDYRRQAEWEFCICADFIFPRIKSRCWLFSAEVIRCWLRTWVWAWSISAGVLQLVAQVNCSSNKCIAV